MAITPVNQFRSSLTNESYTTHSEAVSAEAVYELEKEFESEFNHEDIGFDDLMDFINKNQNKILDFLG